jgi:ATP-dependent exoDNAse (exonuclease V) beta subunit
MPIVLDEESHIYTNTDTGEKYTSVSKLISTYKKPFDSDLHSKRVSQREGVSQDEILNRWKELTVTAQNRGTKIHLIMEEFLKHKKVQKGYEKLAQSFVSKTSYIINNKSIVESEKILHNHDYKIAGTADMVVTNGNFFHILDFKTNKAFNFSSKYNNYFYEPLDFLSECEFNTYTIQLSVYAYMYELMSGKKCSGLKILYYRSFEGKTFWQEIAASYIKPSVKQIFEDYKLKTDSKQNAV